MADTPNPFAGLPESTHKVIEQLLHDIYAAGEWADEHEGILDQWRAERGEAAKDSWGWWFGEVGDESYDGEAPTREKAIALGRIRFAQRDAFRLVEARLWADNVKEGEDVSEFAEIRNEGLILLDPSAISQAEAEARGLA